MVLTNVYHPIRVSNNGLPHAIQGHVNHAKFDDLVAMYEVNFYRP